MADFRLQAPDFSPLWNLVQMKRQDEQMAYEKERQNKLDALAMQEFEEAKKQRTIDNRIRQQNADTNRKIQEQNMLNAEQSRQMGALEMEALKEELETQRLQTDQRKIKLAMGEFGPALEVALGSIEAGQEIPEEVSAQILSGFDSAIGMFRSDMLGQKFSQIKEDMAEALSSGSEDKFESIISDLERVSKFAQAGEEGMSLADQIKLERDLIGLERDRMALASDANEMAESQESAADQAASAKSTFSRMLDNVNFLLEDNRYQAVSGLRRAANPRIGIMPIISGDNQTINARFNNLLSMLSLEEREKLQGSGQISDFEARQLGQGATSLGNEKGIGEEGARQELLRLKTFLEGKLGGGFEFQEQDAGDTPEGTRARDQSGNTIVVRNGKWVKS